MVDGDKRDNRTSASRLTKSARMKLSSYARERRETMIRTIIFLSIYLSQKEGVLDNCWPGLALERKLDGGVLFGYRGELEKVSGEDELCVMD